jgi:hypothetical protein
MRLPDGLRGFSKQESALSGDDFVEINYMRDCLTHIFAWIWNGQADSREPRPVRTLGSLCQVLHRWIDHYAGLVKGQGFGGYIFHESIKARLFLEFKQSVQKPAHFS